MFGRDILIEKITDSLDSKTMQRFVEWVKYCNVEQ